MTRYTDKIEEINTVARISSDMTSDELVTKVRDRILAKYDVSRDLITHLVDGLRVGIDWDLNDAKDTHEAGVFRARKIMLSEMVIYGSGLDEAGILSKGPKYAELIVLKEFQQYEPRPDLHALKACKTCDALAGQPCRWEHSLRGSAL